MPKYFESYVTENNILENGFPGMELITRIYALHSYL